MKYYIIAGEASGDLHASNMIKALKLLDPKAELRCWGGDLMQAEGATLVKHYRDLAFMGFKEVIANIRTILKNIQFCKEDIKSYQPDAVIFVDYPGFNLRIAEYVHTLGIKTIYYISPQVWAWKENRVKKIKKVVDELICILPFEKDFYKKWNYPVHYAGHPLLDAVDQFKHSEQGTEIYTSEKPLILLMPGSRKQEIQKMLPVMLEVAKKHSNKYKFCIAGAPGQSPEYYQQFISNFPKVDIQFGKTYRLLSQSFAALVTSGTATLETALFKVPQVVCYKSSWLSIQIGKMLIKVKYISLVNLILDRKVVTELIQDDLNAKNLEAEFLKITEENGRNELLKSYDSLIELLGNKGASARVATIVYNSLQNKTNADSL